ncbi:hypothetical protein DM01DRAFT_1338379 [Hesseltinella vesiculosa]|uniref:Pentacotripeptide-repeat region of PRORP domain-containing protein n=1 Tax=Hesseltinella vesiculosa TaxID=101127 RepID=A0A1X2GBS4_9FUNG|nr:hypothetical protein DM01DRAFT_1338379 [Hesseltinella vesiculosa]
MSKRLLQTSPQLIGMCKQTQKSWFGSSNGQWFQRFLNEKEEKQLYKSLTHLFRERLNDKANQSQTSYSNIIDHVIFGTQQTPSLLTPNTLSSKVTLSQLEAFKQGMESSANSMPKLDSLFTDMKLAGQHVPTAMYNRLIRAYLHCQAPDGTDTLTKADDVIQAMLQQQNRLPTTRTFTYMIQAAIKHHHLDQAQRYFTMLQHYSLDKFKTAFDCSVMMDYFIAIGNVHALDILWQDILRHKDVIQPPASLYTRYVDWLMLGSSTSSNIPSLHLSPPLFTDRLVSTTRSLLELKKPQKSSAWTQHRVSVWLKVAQELTSSDVPQGCMLAEQLLLHLEHVVDEPTPHPSNTRQGTEAIQHLLYTYLMQAQDFKMVEFYVRLRQSGVKEDVFGQDLINTIGAAVDRVRQGSLSLDQKALMDQYSWVSQG